MIVKSPSAPGNAGSSATDGVVRRRRHTWPSAVEVKSAVSVWLTGRGGSTFGLWLAGPAESRGDDEDAVLVAVAGWHRHGL